MAMEQLNEAEYKLIKYLDEYLIETKKKENFESRVQWLNWIQLFWIHESIIISKQFWFIERLIEKEKIDREKVLTQFTMIENDWLWNFYWHGVEKKQRLLMLLSFQLRPLDFLSSILK